ncbi:MAG: extensin family protein [Pseudomonadota bacterium]
MIGLLVALVLGAAPLPPERPAANLPPIPVPRPERAARPVPAVITEPQAITPTGIVCQDPRLIGEGLADIVSQDRPCGVLSPVRVREVAGVALSHPAVLNCPTARRFADWVGGIAQPAAKDAFGQPIRRLRVMGSYVCRARNHRPGAKISEHGKGRAIDIGGMTLSGGREITLLGDWGAGEAGAFLARLHAQSCGLFHTVLGPDADRLHRDHFHFDTAQRGGDAYCR